MVYFLASVTGDSQVVFLDEPTTGLDPVSRRQVWNILQAARDGVTSTAAGEANGKGRAFVLTTHSMEEAETLCTRIGILAKGRMRCLATQQRLKVLYGGGYKLVLACAASEQEALAREIVRLVPRAVRAPTVGGQLAFRLTPYEARGSSGASTAATTVSEVFALLTEQAAELRLSDWGVSQVSLEDVFEHIIVRSQNDDPY
jgi:ABC-type multidrug transport system ATPase subunit